MCLKIKWYVKSKRELKMKVHSEFLSQPIPPAIYLQLYCMVPSFGSNPE
jgi:hypothetical protein